MDWMIKPQNISGIGTKGFCIVRNCSQKKYCGDYYCFMLHCGKNAK